MSTRTGWREVPRWAPVAVLLCALIAVLGTGHVPASGGERSGGPLASALAAAAVVGAAGALVRPRIAAAVVAAALAGYFARGYPGGPILAAGLGLMFLLGRRTDRVTIVAGLAAIEAGVVVGWAVSGQDGAIALFYPGWAAAAAAVGVAVRNRRSYVDERQARAVSLERSRQEETLRLVAEDRLRIARDLHDGVAHAMATINVQAAAAARVVDRQPTAAKDALAAIARASGTVLDELNGLLTLLRDPAEPAARAPAPGLGDLEALASTVRDAGRRCVLRMSGRIGDVPPPRATAAFRIVQESLTNVLKHSDADEVSVSVCADGDRLTVVIRDDGAPQPVSGAGNGIRGMHERAESTGGRLTAGYTGSGFTVRAEWPAA
jgi:signal transduction histidine kinase